MSPNALSRAGVSLGTGSLPGRPRPPLSTWMVGTLVTGPASPDVRWELRPGSGDADHTVGSRDSASVPGVLDAFA